MSAFKEARFKVGGTVYFFYMDDPYGRAHKIKVVDFKRRPGKISGIPGGAYLENWYRCSLPNGDENWFHEDDLSATYTECRKDWLEYQLLGLDRLIRMQESDLKKATTELNRMKRKRHDIKTRLRRMEK